MEPRASRRRRIRRQFDGMSLVAVAAVAIAMICDRQSTGVLGELQSSGSESSVKKIEGDIGRRRRPRVRRQHPNNEFCRRTNRYRPSDGVLFSRNGHIGRWCHEYNDATVCTTDAYLWNCSSEDPTASTSLCNDPWNCSTWCSRQSVGGVALQCVAAAHESSTHWCTPTGGVSCSEVADRSSPRHICQCALPPPTPAPTPAPTDAPTLPPTLCDRLTGLLLRNVARFAFCPAYSNATACTVDSHLWSCPSGSSSCSDPWNCSTWCSRQSINGVALQCVAAAHESSTHWCTPTDGASCSEVADRSSPSHICQCALPPPTPAPTSPPTLSPSSRPTDSPTGRPTAAPSGRPTGVPSGRPTISFTTGEPTIPPTSEPTEIPTGFPTTGPSGQPTVVPSLLPTAAPILQPTAPPSAVPTEMPSSLPTQSPNTVPSGLSTELPSVHPTISPTETPTDFPTTQPSGQPTVVPSLLPTAAPIFEPTAPPSAVPTEMPSGLPAQSRSAAPTESPSDQIASPPSAEPTEAPSGQRAAALTGRPISAQTARPIAEQRDGQSSVGPSTRPTSPSGQPTEVTTDQPSRAPSGPPAENSKTASSSSNAASSGEAIIGATAFLIVLVLVVVLVGRRKQMRHRIEKRSPMQTAPAVMNRMYSSDPTNTQRAVGGDFGNDNQYANGEFPGGEYCPETAISKIASGVYATVNEDEYASSAQKGQAVYATALPSSLHASNYACSIATTQNGGKRVGEYVYALAPKSSEDSVTDNKGSGVYATGEMTPSRITSAVLKPNGGTFGLQEAVAQWLATAVDRSTAERALTAREYEAGAFCVRKGKGGKPVLSVLGMQGSVVHLRILSCEGGRLKLDTKVAEATGDTFGDIFELVDYYARHVVSPSVERLVGCVPPPEDGKEGGSRRKIGGPVLYEMMPRGGFDDANA